MILCDNQIKRLQTLIDRLHSYIDKHDYRNSDPYTEEEQKAVTEALHLLVGS